MMEDSKDKQYLIEIYKLHGTIADSISRQRGVTNRFYLLLMSGHLILFSGLLRLKNGIPLIDLILGFGILGVVLSSIWYIHLYTYRYISFNKFKLLQAIEKDLEYPVLEIENWEILGGNNHSLRYWKLTVIEAFVPSIFLIAFLLLLFIEVYQILH